MRLLIIGATGATGRETVVEAVRQGHVVVALARGAANLGPGVEVRRGDARDEAALLAALTGVHAVICALGPRPDSPPDLCSQATTALLAAMARSSCRRLVLVSGAMIGHPPEHLHGMYRLIPYLLPAGQRAAIDDRRAAEALVMASDLDWTILRPPRLADGTAQGKVRVGEALRIGSFAKIRRADLARLLVEEATTAGHSRQALAAVG